MQIRKYVKKIWNDPVGANLIAWIIISIFGLIFSYFAYNKFGPIISDHFERMVKEFRQQNQDDADRILKQNEANTNRILKQNEEQYKQIEKLIKAHSREIAENSKINKKQVEELIRSNKKLQELVYLALVKSLHYDESKNVIYFVTPNNMEGSVSSVNGAEYLSFKLPDGTTDFDPAAFIKKNKLEMEKREMLIKLDRKMYKDYTECCDETLNSGEGNYLKLLKMRIDCFEKRGWGENDQTYFLSKNST